MFAPTIAKAVIGTALVAGTVGGGTAAPKPPQQVATAATQAPMSQGADKVTPPTPKQKTQGFGANPQMYKGEGHGGVDYANSCGGSVEARAIGRVTGIGRAADNGDYVEITSYDGVRHIHGHTDTAVAVGTSVTQGTVIGKTNMSGTSTGCHEHWETIYPDGKKHDPETWLKEPNPCPHLYGVPATWGVVICAASAKYVSDPSLVASILFKENGMAWPGFDKYVCSTAGACGIGQFMPGTWAGHKVDGDGNGVPEIKSWQDNVHTTAAMVGKMKKDLRGVAVEYNCGPFCQNPNNGQTVDYIQGVSKAYATFRR